MTIAVIALLTLLVVASLTYPLLLGYSVTEPPADKVESSSALGKAEMEVPNADQETQAPDLAAQVEEEVKVIRERRARPSAGHNRGAK